MHSAAYCELRWAIEMLTILINRIRLLLNTFGGLYSWSYFRGLCYADSES